jgi:hypothetical protein
MFAAWLADNANLPTQGLVARFHKIDVLANGHDFIRVTNNRQDRDIRFGNWREIVHRVLVIGERLLFRKPVNLQQCLPIAPRARPPQSRAARCRTIGTPWRV